MKFQGIVLAGGKSSRFGEDKALALVDGMPMIQRTVNLLTELQLDPCVITNASRDYSFLTCRIERDLVPDKGPMGGLYTAGCLFEDCSLVVLTCDMPALTSASVRYLIERHKKDNGATVYSCKENFKHPFPGVYETSLRDSISKFIEIKQMSMQELFKAIPEINVLGFPFDQGMLSNINEKRDLNYHPFLENNFLHTKIKGKKIRNVKRGSRF
ncbi:MAG: molybdenum cofactor guanylyltransferase [Desulfobacterales bacterium]|nr:molybdenum cofactor guanylyltransferase [Desulfobacterales bacterium]